MKIRICFDVYNISERIRDIDENYRIVFDTDRNVYEVHNLSQIGSTYALTIPYKELDSRVLDLVYQTMSTDAETIFAKIDNDNRLQESAEKYRTQQQLIDILDGR